MDRIRELAMTWAVQIAARPYSIDKIFTEARMIELYLREPTPDTNPVIIDEQATAEALVEDNTLHLSEDQIMSEYAALVYRSAEENGTRLEQYAAGEREWV